MYEVDLTKIDGNGAFPCPKCGTVISPDDDGDETYTIESSNVKNDGLEALIVRCNKCKSLIRLTGFLDAKVE